MAAKKAPWRKPNAKKKKKGGSRKLSPAQKVRAKRSARIRSPSAAEGLLDR
jgi:hypothetical protein